MREKRVRQGNDAPLRRRQLQACGGGRPGAAAHWLQPCNTHSHSAAHLEKEVCVAALLEALRLGTLDPLHQRLDDGVKLRGGERGGKEQVSETAGSRRTAESISIPAKRHIAKTRQPGCAPSLHLPATQLEL